MAQFGNPKVKEKPIKLCSVEDCERPVVNSKFKLCLYHNKTRLQAIPKPEREKTKNLVNRPIKQEQEKPKKKRTKNPTNQPIRKQNPNMRDLFLEIWNEREHKCIQCSKELGDEPLAHYFSHIKARNVAPSLKYSKGNIDILCLECHQERDFGYKQKK